MNNLTIGHDSEFGLHNQSGIVSALGVIPQYEGSSGRYFPDNMNCEIAINPCSTLKEFHSYTEDLLDRVRSEGYDLLMKPVIVYPDKYLSHPDAEISGCNPDYSGYTSERNQSPDFKGMDGTRSCGAHIHAGIKDLDPYNWARWMDIYLALPLLAVEEKTTRRAMYGGAGALREKPYGGEYRTLSNVWLDNPSYREFVWEGTHKAVEMSMSRNTRDLDSWADVPTAIDTHNTELARRTLDRLYLLGVPEL